MKATIPLPTTPGIYECKWGYPPGANEYQYYNFFDGEIMYSGHVAKTIKEYERRINERILNGIPFMKLSDEWTLLSWELKIPYGKGE